MLRTSAPKYLTGAFVARLAFCLQILSQLLGLLHQPTNDYPTKSIISINTQLTALLTRCCAVSPSWSQAGMWATPVSSVHLVLDALATAAHPRKGSSISRYCGNGASHVPGQAYLIQCGCSRKVCQGGSYVTFCWQCSLGDARLDGRGIACLALSPHHGADVSLHHGEEM